jgi:glycosyltransferase involved in cell wall biosynthesis
MTNELDVSVVICTRNRPRDLDRVLSSLAWQRTTYAEILVIDDSDPDRRHETADVCAQSDVPVTVLTKATPGLTASRNLALSRVTGALAMFLDDDVVLRPDYVAKIVAAFAEHGELVGATGSTDDDHEYGWPWLRHLLMVPGRPTGQVYPSGWAAQPPRRRTRNVQWLTGCNMTYRTSAVESYRFNDEFQGYALGEDVEFSHRLHLDGHRLMSVGDAHVWHVTSLPKSDRAWGYREMVIRPIVGGGRFNRFAFLISSLTFLLSNAVTNRERAAGNVLGIRDVLRRRPPRDIQAVRKGHSVEAGERAS